MGASLIPATALAENDGWQYRITPYGWLPTLYTDLAIGPNQPVESDTSLLDILDFAALLSGEIRKGDWGVIGEINYLALSQDASTPGGKLKAKMSMSGVMGGAAIAYRAFKDERSSIDVFGGFRAWSLDASIDFKHLNKVSTTKSWIDPIIGLRGHYDLTPDFFVDGLAEIGGFGVGSDFQWELVGRVGYRITESISASVGYRHLALDFKDGKLVVDAAMTGPMVAFDFTF